jgi:malonyl-CoA O-methyltransferase
LDWARQLIRQAPTKLNIHKICAAPDHVPLADKSVDLIIGNLVWHWTNAREQCLREWRRLLKPGGLILFTTCGPDTLYELRDSFAAVDDHSHVHLFVDMHDIGDAMVAARFAEPVLQAEHILFNYSSITKLWRDLKGSGATHVMVSRRRTLTGKKRWQKMLVEYQKYAAAEEGWPVTFEVIYGIGWAEQSPASFVNEQGEAIVPIHQIKRRI